MRRFLCVLSLMAFGAATAQATVIDDFSSDKSALYDTVLAYNGIGQGAAAYAINASNQFEPTGGGGSTTEWYRKDGYVWNVGDTIGIDVVAVAPLTSSVMGLVASKSLTAETNAAAFYIQDVGNPSPSWNVGIGPTNVAAPADFTLNSPATVTATRTGDTSASYDFAYASSLGGTAHLTGSISLSSGTYYFGMIKYGQYGSIGDNLSYTPAPTPEPSSLVLLTCGLIGLLAYAWRKRR